ncbi:XPG domain containing-domain-containing protein [Daldinia decipiens]|uniref:XPG domain containing-domain-containing protein n=1 Tax=Daldinia decipiens TaxID=326647 RepID=UPI0020C1EA9A|nr:XPG domain containing-domain-containing protein [Daldinia decipiens]KAI1659851.1 XPG domain containing-domain-containing protein [Daldinia decipiens]
MGIRGFTQGIQRFGVFSPLSGDTVVIDGPALVHRISDAVCRQRPSTSGFACQPPYSLLSRMVIGWLDELKNHNVNVRKIYFDGYLPPSKWQVRQERLVSQSQSMKALASSRPFGSPTTPEGAFRDVRANTTLTRISSRSLLDALPKPAFMIPAVLEALKASEDWGPLVVVVPGEADIFCAQDIRENGGTLLTNDSDLLIQDLGVKGCMSFLWDVIPVDPDSKESGMVAMKISLHDINDRLGLTNLGGLPRVAFEKQKGWMSFDAAVQKVRNSHEDTLHSPEYQAFVDELQGKEYMPSHHPVFTMLSSLDPRISEVVVQILLLEQMEENPTESDDPAELDDPTELDEKTLRGPETLSIFLPVMVENHDKRSAWTSSTNIRQIGYSILQNLARQRYNKIIEYRTLDPSTSLTGRQIEIPNFEETADNCTQLVTVLDKLAEALPSSLQWLAFAVYQDIEWSTSEQRPSLSATLVNKIINGSKFLEEYSWDLIHFTAQVQACLYSLRIVKQILDVVVSTSTSQDLPAPALQLHNRLTLVPLIGEWPTIEHMSDLMSKFGNAEGLRVITDMLGIPSIEIAGPSEDPTGPRERQKRDTELLPRNGRQRDIKISPSINPYAILSQECED